MGILLSPELTPLPLTPVRPHWVALWVLLVLQVLVVLSVLPVLPAFHLPLMSQVLLRLLMGLLSLQVILPFPLALPLAPLPLLMPLIKSLRIMLTFSGISPVRVWVLERILSLLLPV